MPNKNDYQDNQELTLNNIRTHFNMLVNYNKHPSLHPQSSLGHSRLLCTRVMRALVLFDKVEQELKLAKEDIEKLKVKLKKLKVKLTELETSSLYYDDKWY